MSILQGSGDSPARDQEWLQTSLLATVAFLVDKGGARRRKEVPRSHGCEHFPSTVLRPRDPDSVYGRTPGFLNVLVVLASPDIFLNLPPCPVPWQAGL